MNNYQARFRKSVFQYFDLIQGNDHLENYNFKKKTLVVNVYLNHLKI